MPPVDAGFKNFRVATEAPGMSEKVAQDEHVCPGEAGPNPKDRMELVASEVKRPEGFTKTCTVCGTRLTVRRPDRVRPYWAGV